ncbi:Tumor protein 63 [Nymphon striatum]|nr:Tumor protein 63 [Nymphon striatum]
MSSRAPPGYLSPPGQIQENVDAGPYTFQVKVDESAKCYADNLNKLYINIDSPCVIQMFTLKPPIVACNIRITLRFGNPVHENEIVTRCVQHSLADNSTAENEIANHIIRCESNSAIYLKNPVTKEYEVLVPYVHPSGIQWLNLKICKAPLRDMLKENPENTSSERDTTTNSEKEVTKGKYIIYVRIFLFSEKLHRFLLFYFSFSSHFLLYGVELGMNDVNHIIVELDGKLKLVNLILGNLDT